MTWLWEKVRQSLRSGRLRKRIQKFLEIRNSIDLSSSSVDDSNSSSECEGDDLISFFGICSACKLAIRRCRNFNFSAFEFLSSPSRCAICPFCGVRYGEAIERQTLDSNDVSTRNAVADGSKETICEREQQSRRDSAVEHNRLPPIDDYQSEAGRIRNYGSNTSSLGHAENLNSLLSHDLSITLLLPPIIKDNEFDPSRHVELRSRRSSLISKGDKESYVCKESAEPFNSDTAFKTRQEFLKHLRKARQSENYSVLLYFYMRTFSSFRELCSLLKIDPLAGECSSDDPGLKFEFIYSIHDAIHELPSLFEKTILKSVINSLLEKSKGNVFGDEVRSVFILLQCPIFSSQSSYIVFAHLLRYCINLPSSHHRLLVGWFKILDVRRLRATIHQLMQFIGVRQFSAGDKYLPPMNKCRWWIPVATKVLALINIANNDCSPPRISYTEFYNYALDHLDLMQDYYVWQNCRHPGQFAYCQYPFILSILAKRFILTKVRTQKVEYNIVRCLLYPEDGGHQHSPLMDCWNFLCKNYEVPRVEFLEKRFTFSMLQDSEQQMILNARKSLVTKVSRHQTPQIDIFFLNINVRRSHLVDDSLNEITCKQRDLKKKLKVSFVGEPGLDMGGLTKEWFLLLVREIFDSSYGMFVHHRHSHRYWFSIDSGDGNLSEYNLIGVLMGLAVYNSNILDLRFPSVCYRKLLTPPVVPHVSCNQIGVIQSPTLDDLSEIMPDVTTGLRELLAYEGNVEEDMGITFQISVEEFGAMKTFQLKPNGEEILVNNENRKEYVQCYLNWVLNTAIYKQFEAFYLGFHSVCASNALIMLRGEEIEMLVCGSQNLNLAELREVTEYDGFDPDEECMENFWEIVETMSHELKRKFLLFTTGSDRIPIGGASEMSFKISRLAHKIDNLPEAHTCFNQLVMPRYKNKVILRKKLVTAISNSEGFGLE